MHGATIKFKRTEFTKIKRASEFIKARLVTLRCASRYVAVNKGNGNLSKNN